MNITLELIGSAFVPVARKDRAALKELGTSLVRLPEWRLDELIEKANSKGVTIVTKAVTPTRGNKDAS